MKRLIDLVRRYADDAWIFARLICSDVLDTSFVIHTILVIASLIGVAAIISFHQDGDAREMDESVVVFKVHGEAHEYLRHGHGLTHLPNCKFCEGETE